MPYSTRSRIDRTAWAASLLIALTAASGARAQEAPDAGTAVVPEAPPSPSPAEQLARSETEKGSRQYDLGRFQEAIAHYARAYEAMPLPALLFNIAQCHRQLRQHRQAAFFYRRYLDLSNNPPNAAVAKELLAEMESRAARTDEEQQVAARAKQALQLKTPGPTEPEPPLYQRWWFWAAAGGVVAASATAAAIVASAPPAPSLGTVNGR